MIPSSRIRTLVLYARSRRSHSYYDDWSDAFAADPGFDSVAVNLRGREGAPGLARTIGEFDLVVLLHSANADSMDDLRPCADALCRRRGKLLAFVGNEVNLPGISMAEKIGFLRKVEADLIGTQLPLAAGEWLYAECTRSRVVPLPHALNPAAFRPGIPPERREIDIGVRAFHYYPLLGDDERNSLFRRFGTGRFDPPLSVDIRTDVRLDREGWAGFLNRCRGTVSTEAGSYYLERDDRTLGEILDWVAQRQAGKGGYAVGKGSPAERAWRALPASWRRVLKGALVSAGFRNESTMAETVPFSEIHEKFFRGRPRAPVHSKAISSRHFDASGTKTCQILVRGEYNGILRPNEHYIPVSADLSDVDEAVSRFRDVSLRTAMVDRTYAYVMEEHTYRNRMDDVRRWVEPVR